MGNKNKKLLFLGIFLAGVFFVAKNVKADCYDACADNSNPDECFTQCQASYGGASTKTSDTMTSTLNSWDCSEYPGTVPNENGDCVSPTERMSDGTCSKNADCGAGFTCYQNSCVDNQTYQDNTAWYNRAWKSTTDFFTGNSSTPDSAGSSLFKVNGALNIPGVGSVPAGSTISSTGVVTSPDGRELGYVDQNTLGGLTQTGNVSGININFGGSSSGGSGSGYSYSGSGGSYAQAKCPPNFKPVGGVCFPNQSVTGLSEASITDLLVGLFNWLMGIFILLSVIAFVVSGLMYVTAYGDDAQMKKAKQNATWAVYGIVIGFSGFIVVQAVARMLGGSTMF